MGNKMKYPNSMALHLTTDTAIMDCFICVVLKNGIFKHFHRKLCTSLYGIVLLSNIHAINICDKAAYFELFVSAVRFADINNKNDEFIPSNTFSVPGTKQL